MEIPKTYYDFDAHRWNICLTRSDYPVIYTWTAMLRMTRPEWTR